MNQKKYYLTASLALVVLAACSSNYTIPVPDQDALQTQEITSQTASNTGSFHMPLMRQAYSPEQIVNDFRRLDSVLATTKSGDDNAPAQFLATENESAMGETVRNEWLKSLGRRNQIILFRQQYMLLHSEARQQETRCYAHLLALENDLQFINDLIEETGKLAQGCNTLLQIRANSLNPSRAWRRVRGLIASGQISDANALAAALGSPLNSGSGYGWQENLLRDVISPTAQKSPDSAAARLTSIAGNLNNEQVGFAWGVLGLTQARNQNFSQALNYYQKANRNQLNNEQFEWFARSALRTQNWILLGNVIQSMPSKLQQDPAWMYWLARSLASQNNHAAARSLYQRTANSGRNFYALLAIEELGQRVNTHNTAPNTLPQHIEHLAKDGAIHRALSLFYTSKQNSDFKMRRQAQAEWRYATRGMNEATLLTAAQLAFNHQFYEMAIYSADKTDHLLNYHLRYIMPYRDLVVRYANENNVDPAWVYGLIRQESRFVMGAQSSVGAQGLMQVMPATANMIAKKIGMSNNELYTINGNIRMGTWYMADARRNLQNNEVLATAGYNAGPGRARKWQSNTPLEGAIYAETIPFNETRDYVKKVMANTTYYASLLGSNQTSLKQRMGIIPARY